MQKEILIQSLKLALKERGITYKILAEKLKMGHSSVRRIFSTHNMGLDKLEEICHVLNLSFHDLAKMSLEQLVDHPVLNTTQELALAGDPKLFCFFYLITIGRTPAYITDHYDFDGEEKNSYLLKLNKLRLIDLFPNEKVRPLFSSDVKWSPGGPLEKRYKKEGHQEFWSSNFDGKFEALNSLFVKLSPASIEILSKKIQKLVLEIESLSANDKALEKNDQFEDMFFIFSYRPWAFSAITSYRRSVQSTFMN